MSLSFILRSEQQGIAGRSRSTWLLTTFKGVIAAYTNWRVERAAIAVLSSMNDLMLKDIGLSRCQITGAVWKSRHQSLDDVLGAVEQPLEAAS